MRCSPRFATGGTPTGPGSAGRWRAGCPARDFGVLAVVALSPQVFALLVGLGVLICVPLSLLSWRPRPRSGSLLLAGLVSGAGGTAASIGGPPLALLYQEAAGPRVRGKIGAYFVPGSVISLDSLH